MDIPEHLSLSFINFLNNKLEEIIIKCAKKTIPTKIRWPDGYNSLKPKDVVLTERFLKFATD